ncbi:MAG: tRNA (adenosine(37)-N6)-threonylcarbamoyltransferase complex dimerization subunit type 1 TsaB [Candidatus Omnitrophota bacterium]|nr:tRNA (adenosine(37)-N6)-threonylcarbamoyltransferase complex dimerization subunit type 1 TsaB [Candidatus Omnitrophota bacterium]
MKILAIDTSTNFLCLGLSDGERLYECNLELGRRLSSLLIPTLEKALRVLSWRINDINYFGCGLGPGSFTGLRLGLATVKGFSWALNKPLAGIPSLDILAAQLKGEERPLAVIVDARRGFVYCGLYRNKNGRVKRIAPYSLLNEKELLKSLKDNSIILGNAVNLYREKILNKVKSATILDKDYWYPKAHNMIELVLERIRDKKISGAFDIRPIYLYPKECQIK